MRDHIKDRRALIAVIMNEGRYKFYRNVEMVFFCAVVIPATYLFLILCLSIGDIK
jgi:uncharacterized paraquat-inducible protein A